MSGLCLEKKTCQTIKQVTVSERPVSWLRNVPLSGGDIVTLDVKLRVYINLLSTPNELKCLGKMLQGKLGQEAHVQWSCCFACDQIPEV